MTQHDILRMAREAGLGHMPGWMTLPAVVDNLERFAALVAAATRESMKAEGWRACAVGQRTTQHCGLLETAVLVEREACARVADEWSRYEDDAGAFIGEAIRARGAHD